MLCDGLGALTRNRAQEAGLWLLPVDDDRSQGGARPGLHEGLTLSCYFRLVDASGRMIRAGKASLEADLAPIFERLNLDRHALEATPAKLFQPSERVPNQWLTCEFSPKVRSENANPTLSAFSSWTKLQPSLEHPPQILPSRSPVSAPTMNHHLRPTRQARPAAMAVRGLAHSISGAPRRVIHDPYGRSNPIGRRASRRGYESASQRPEGRYDRRGATQLANPGGLRRTGGHRP